MFLRSSINYTSKCVYRYWRVQKAARGSCVKSDKRPHLSQHKFFFLTVHHEPDNDECIAKSVEHLCRLKRLKLVCAHSSIYSTMYYPATTVKWSNIMLKHFLYCSTCAYSKSLLVLKWTETSRLHEVKKSVWKQLGININDLKRMSSNANPPVQSF